MVVLSVENSTASCAYTNHNGNQIHLLTEPITITYHEIRIDLSDLKEISVIEEIIIKNHANSSISVFNCWLNQSHSSLIVEDKEGDLQFEEVNIDESSSLINMNFSSPLETNQTVRISLNYVLEVEPPLIEGNHKYYSFMFKKAIFYYTTSYKIIVRLPKNSFIHEDENNPYSYFPEDAELDSSGDILYVIWDFSGVQAYSEMFVFVLFDEPIAENQNIWVPIVSPIAGIVVGATGVYLWTHRKSKKTMKKVGSIFLTSDQKMLLYLIVESEGRMSQKEFIKLTGYTKSKISRNLIPLEKQGLIRKEKWGREFRIFITKDGRKMVE